MQARALMPWMLLVSGALAPPISGCASDCDKVRKQYESTITAQSPFVAQAAASDDLPVHIGVAVRHEVLNEVVDRAMRDGLQKALSFTESVSLATGQKIGLTTDGSIADVGLYPDSSCDECLRVEGRLGGSLTVKLPVLGSQKVPLQGTFTLVAPVMFARGEDGRSQVKLDLAQAAKLGKSHVDPEVTQLPPTWWKVVKGPLGELMIEAMTRDLPPVTLFSFQAPDLGIDGLEIAPARIVSDAKRGVVFAGFHTNLAVPGEVALEPRTELGKNDDIAIGVDQRVLGPMAVAMMQSGKLDRRYTKDGKPDDAGPIHVTMESLSLGPGTEAASEYEATFRAWNLPEEGKCWWAQTSASGQIAAADDGQMTVSIESAEVVDSSLPGIFQTVANWRTSSLLQRSSKVVTKSLAPDGLQFPGGALNLQKANLQIGGTAAWLNAGVAVGDSDDEGSEPAGEEGEESEESEGE